MAEWNIDPTGVNKIVDRVSVISQDLDRQADPSKLEAVLGGLTWGGGVTSCVADAVGQAMNSQAERIANVKTRIGAGLHGAVGATIAYINADEQMASDMQGHAAEAAVTGDFGWFKKNRVW